MTKIWTSKPGIIVSFLVAVTILGAFWHWHHTINIEEMNGNSMPISSITPNSSPQASSKQIDPMSAWKIYRNEEYGFEVKYPENLIPQSEKDSDGTYLALNTSKSAEAPYYFLRVDKTGYKDLDTWFNDEFSAKRSKNMVPTKEEAKIGNNYPALKISDPMTLGACLGEYFVVINDGYLYRLPDHQCLNDGIIKSINSTFKLVNNSGISDSGSTETSWKTYTNAQYGFEFKYPSDWTSKSGKGLFIGLHEDKYRTYYMADCGPVLEALGVYDNTEILGDDSGSYTNKIVVGTADFSGQPVIYFEYIGNTFSQFDTGALENYLKTGIDKSKIVGDFSGERTLFNGHWILSSNEGNITSGGSCDMSYVQDNKLKLYSVEFIDNGKYAFIEIWLDNKHASLLGQILSTFRFTK